MVHLDGALQQLVDSVMLRGKLRPIRWTESNHPIIQRANSEDGKSCSRQIIPETHSTRSHASFDSSRERTVGVIETSSELPGEPCSFRGGILANSDQYPPSTHRPSNDSSVDHTTAQRVATGSLHLPLIGVNHGVETPVALFEGLEENNGGTSDVSFLPVSTAETPVDDLSSRLPIDDSSFLLDDYLRHGITILNIEWLKKDSSLVSEVPIVEANLEDLAETTWLEHSTRYLRREYGAIAFRPTVKVSDFQALDPAAHTVAVAEALAKNPTLSNTLGIRDYVSIFEDKEATQDADEGLDVDHEENIGSKRKQKVKQAPPKKKSRQRLQRTQTGTPPPDWRPKNLIVQSIRPLSGLDPQNLTDVEEGRLAGLKMLKPKSNHHKSLYKTLYILSQHAPASKGLKFHSTQWLQEAWSLDRDASVSEGGMSGHWSHYIASSSVSPATRSLLESLPNKLHQINESSPGTQRVYVAGMSGSADGRTVMDIIGHPHRQLLQTLSRELLVAVIYAELKVNPQPITDPIEMVQNIKFLYDGILSPWIYGGTPHTFCPLHQEDGKMPSANYLVSGFPKVWLVLPRSSIKLLEDALSFGLKRCFLYHRRLWVHPLLLLALDIPFNVLHQQSGDLALTNQLSAHEGWNAGNNLVESINFINNGAIEDIISNEFNNNGLVELSCVCNIQLIHRHKELVADKCRYHPATEADSFDGDTPPLVYKWIELISKADPKDPLLLRARDIARKGELEERGNDLGSSP
ncbi:Lysine-specific demethylase 4C [Serendipita sp. 396]|nr:Lysine-specific demethylase 4C [Serendipita sp. 396]KAG8783784.1 Lysine-specific demethylase 4C [Serendipita sp. 397]KAG8796882.1 Lysine-specific demethylase 4C [Serendipita sp. 398]KAG8867683.1 Lysine-specific demethylase 4C [Serendipita sp. 405]